ncbi:prepilin peptidase [Brevibacillus sp. TJ4]|uniref:prepilin peptidase n=1 Tax=Brevibacillus sp. TJ4 TaxID=3234853 RepID=UPI003BA337C1
MSAYVIIPMLVFLAIAVYTDVRQRLIYDWLTIPATAYFLLYYAFTQPEKLPDSALGTAILGGISLVMAMVSKGQLGGGDIKLFAMVGAALGWQAGLLSMGLTYLIAGAVAIPLWILSKVTKREAAAEMAMAPFIASGAALLFGMAFIT